MKSIVMKRAWEIKRENIKYIFGLCLEMAWQEIKEKKENKESMKDKLINMGFKFWKKSDSLQRVYINTQNKKFGIHNVPNCNYKRFKNLNMFYDVVEDCFKWNFIGNSSTETINEYIDFLTKTK